MHALTPFNGVVIDQTKKAACTHHNEQLVHDFVRLHDTIIVAVAASAACSCERIFSRRLCLGSERNRSLFSRHVAAASLIQYDVYV